VQRKHLVLDANILLRGVFGRRVRHLLETYEDAVTYYTPDTCVDDATKYIPALAEKRALDPAPQLLVLAGLLRLVDVIDINFYNEYEQTARARIASRDSADWPIVAVALLLDCPVWTEDQDFFGSGIATWTSSTIDLYLRER
jgi:predicted nucleic acid-binding protein